MMKNLITKFTSISAISTSTATVKPIMTKTFDHKSMKQQKSPATFF